MIVGLGEVAPLIAPLFLLALSVYPRTLVGKPMIRINFKSLIYLENILKVGFSRILMETPLLAWGARGREFESRHADQ